MTMWVNLTNPPVVYERHKYTHTHTHTLAHACERIQAHAECVSERRDYSFCDNAAGSCFDMSALPAAASVLDGTDSEPDVWNSMLLKMQHLWTPLVYFMGKPLDFHLWIFKVSWRVFMPFRHISHDQPWLAISFLASASAAQRWSSSAGCTSSNADPWPLRSQRNCRLEVKGHRTAWLFIGPLRASVKVKAHKAAGWSHKHINTHIHQQYIHTHRTHLELDRLLLVVAAGDGRGHERLGSTAPLTLSSSGGLEQSISNLSNTCTHTHTVLKSWLMWEWIDHWKPLLGQLSLLQMTILRWLWPSQT